MRVPNDAENLVVVIVRLLVVANGDERKQQRSLCVVDANMRRTQERRALAEDRTHFGQHALTRRRGTARAQKENQEAHLVAKTVVSDVRVNGIIAAETVLGQNLAPHLGATMVQMNCSLCAM
jgi:hypothetical protein